MANHYTNKVTCFACNYNCQLINGSAEPIYHCNLKKAISWPDNNIYFREGLHHLLFREETRIFCRGHIFLDFSLYNIRYFTNRDWIQLLKSLGLKVIIICDPIMAPLAAFVPPRIQSIYRFSLPKTFSMNWEALVLILPANI